MSGWFETQHGIVTEREVDAHGTMRPGALTPKLDTGALYVLARCGLLYPDIHPRNLAMATVVLTIRYHAPLRECDRFQVDATPARIGRSSLRYLQRLRNLTTGRVAVSYDIIETLMDFTARKSTPFPDDLRAGIEPLVTALTPADARLFEDPEEPPMPTRDRETPMNAGWAECQRGIVTEDDIDFNRHMSVKDYFPKFERACFYLVSQVGLYYGDLHACGLSMATVRHRLRYLAEMVEGDPFVIEGAFVRIGRTSARYVFKMINLRAKALAASCDVVEVLFDMEERKAVPWPDDLRAGIEDRLTALEGDDKDLFDG